MINYIKLIRIHQWSKNILIFLPLFFSHQMNNSEFIYYELIGFISFSLCASSTYIINDIFDLDSDRKHPSKKNRPLANKKISIHNALIISISLLILSILIGYIINIKVIYLILIYFISSLLYSKYLKKIIYFDCIILSGFYLYRMYFGCNIIEINFSFWLIFFSFCLFFSLALLKRYNELEFLKKNKILKNYKRNYSYKRDVKLLKNIGLFSGILSCLILMSYSQSFTANEYYNNPNLIILSGIALIFWIDRIWKKAKIINMNDPVEFALKDLFTYFVFLLIVLIFIFSKIDIV